MCRKEHLPSFLSSVTRFNIEVNNILDIDSNPIDTTGNTINTANAHFIAGAGGEVLQYRGTISANLFVFIA